MKIRSIDWLHTQLLCLVLASVTHDSTIRMAFLIASTCLLVMLIISLF